MFVARSTTLTKPVMAPASPDRTKDRRALICACWQLSTAAIEIAIDQGERTVSALANGCGAGGGCGSCRFDVEKILLRKLGRVDQGDTDVDDDAGETQLSLFSFD